MNKQYISTILIPTYERSRDLGRLLKFLTDEKITDFARVMVLDGSEKNGDCNEAICHQYNVEYKHYGSKYSVAERVLDGIEYVETDIVSMLADDDFINLAGYLECVNFLMEHEDYAVAHGQYAYFVPNEPEKLKRVYKMNSIDGEMQLERLYRFLENYVPIVYDVYRTETLEAALRGASLYFRSEWHVGELLLCCIPVLMGKVKVLDCFYYARKAGQSIWDISMDIPRYLFSKEYSGDYGKLKQGLLKYIDVERYTQKQAEGAVDYAFATYYTNYFKKVNSMINGFNSLGLKEKIENIDTISIQLTNHFNLQDNWGFSEDDKAIKGLPFEEYLKLLGMAKQIGIKKVELCMHGESLVYPRLIDAINSATMFFENVSLTTNGALLTEEMAQRLFETQLGTLIVSVTGFTQETYDKFQGCHGELQLEQVNKNILNALQVQSQSSLESKTEIMLQYILTDDSVHDLKRYVDFWADKVEDINITYLKSIVDSDVVRPVNVYRSCPDLGKQIGILSNGDVTACCSDYLGSNVIGNIGITTLSQIISSSKYLKMLERNNEVEIPQMPSLCQSCDRILEDSESEVKYSLVSVFIEGIKQLDPTKKYVLWGLNAHTTATLVGLAMTQGNLNNIKVVDSFKMGSYFGLPIETPSPELLADKTVIVYVEKKFQEVSTYLMEHGIEHLLFRDWIANSTDYEIREIYDLVKKRWVKLRNRI